MAPVLPPFPIALLAVLLQLSFGAGAAGPRFSLAAERTRYLLGEPIYLRMGSRDGAPPSLEEGLTALSILGPDGKERLYRPPLRFRLRPADGRSGGDSGRVKVRFARLIASEGGLLFPQPGRYRLRLVSPAPEGIGSLSDSLTVEFRAPVSGPDRRAYSLIARDPGEYALAVYLEGGDQLGRGMAILREMAGFGNAYASLASFVLSCDWAQDFTEYRDGEGKGSRSLDLRKALAFAQWDRSRGGYIPLRNAYRLASAAELMARRNPAAPGLAETRRKVAAFLASLTPEESSWFSAF